MSFVQDKILLLKGTVQHYAWGGYDYIPSWLGIENTEQQTICRILDGRSSIGAIFCYLRATAS